MPNAARRFPRSIATVCLSGTLLDKLEAAAAAGFDGVEIFESDLLTFDGSPADVRRVAEGLGLAITLFQPFRDFEAMPEPPRARNMDRAERKFDVMQALGTDLVLVCSNTQPAAIDDDARAAADLAEMAGRAARRGLRVGYEALAWGQHVRRWGHAWKIVRQAGHDSLGLIVDSFHTLAIGDDPVGIADVPAEKLFFVQLADAPRLSMDVLSWSRHFRNFPGQGELDVGGFLGAVTRSGYRGPISLEVFNDEFRSAPARLNARDGLRSLVLAEAQAGVLDLPAPPRSSGFAFLEFAVDLPARAKLGTFLESLGFRLEGRHRSKDVLLYRQGDISLVLNSEQDSAAAEHFQMHGPSVCAMAVKVDDAGRALARARALFCSEWQERRREDEWPLAGIRAADGTLVLLIDDAEATTSWEDDFLPLPHGAEGPLTRVDHVAHALPTGNMDSFVLFWRGVFGLEPQPVLEIADPQGLIRSRAMVSADGALRLPLNISESRNTSTGRFLTAFAGAGVHHVAFEVSDIFAAVRQLRESGFASLPIPPNYYDDLAARWGLDDALLEELHRHDVLYDRDAGGELFHVYSRTFESRFFFEIIERRGATGFGAANAAVRMAAQAR
ncbi:bifunctional sugar phosphate isomerase/epimerase/4-hydroxyphenylpyruvate dioxygenase family protein [Roseomonas marmotae]|uniref:3-dehydroshikimate dehydratase n=1 Tax=Roseomonas marmotae TaxID=2768161 RepID=A0ABS3K7P6_9PROT|nr:sugar phosphate isomerase/epimerase and 4-hydroxyphenylpyruvate domain-containing protein [Roseomonas marmotae]MBO1073495.1 sugar phosphate isomerase/epimerase and 4-hydroxyphenylpyruvate domain-containing protein [Roseomonas marmotae]QTI80316.1 sugar phosphate isomerase/epimerase and 4-hydroxyphenylpyruvate domain-containing protein [Roseomonas marmotae]